jgi:hypothetical protein
VEHQHIADKIYGRNAHQLHTVQPLTTIVEKGGIRLLIIKMHLDKENK